MACDSIDTPITLLIRYAYSLAGRTTNTLNGPSTSNALNILNSILAQWSQNTFIFYDSQIEFDATGTPGDYIITKRASTADNVIQANPFVDVFEVWYSVGGIDYLMTHMQKQPFDAIPLKEVGSYPKYFNARNTKDSTILRLYPYPTSGMRIKVYGTQRLDDVSLFQSEASFPDWAYLPLAYELANQLVVSGGYTPSSGFNAELSRQRRLVKAQKRRDPEYDYSHAFRPANIARRYSRGGSW